MMSLEGNRLDSGPTVADRVLALSPREDSLLILLFGGIVFTVAPAPEFINLDARFALFAREMLRNGLSFFPTSYGMPYPDYPASSTVLVYLASLPWGRVTPLTLVLPTAVVSALVLVVLYRIGVLHSRARGLYAVLFALFTVEFVAVSRGVALDQYTSLAATLSFYLVYSSDRLGRNRRLWLVPSVWILGFAFRGPVGLLIPAGVTGAYYLSAGRFRRTLLVGVLAGGLLALCLGALVLAARAQGGMPLVKEVLEAEVTGRFNDRGQGIAYYWYGSLISYAVSYPLAMLVIASRFRRVARRRTQEDRFLGALALWVVVVLGAMSIPATKKIRYVLPIVPALALIASSLMVAPPVAGLLGRVRRVFLGFCDSLPAASVVGLGGFLLFAYLRRPEWCTGSLIALALVIPLLAVAWKLDRGWRQIPNRDLYVQAVGVATFLVIQVCVVSPVIHSSESTAPFVRQVEALCEESPGAISFFRVGPDAEDVKFMANASRLFPARFAGSIEALRETPDLHYVITKESVFRALPAEESELMQVLAQGRIGHRDFVLLAWDGNR